MTTSTSTGNLSTEDAGLLAHFSPDHDFILDATSLQPRLNSLVERGLLAPTGRPGYRLTPKGAAAAGKTRLNEATRYLRNLVSSSPKLGPADAEVINIDALDDDGGLILDLDDGTSIDLRIRRYPRHPTTDRNHR